MIDGKSVKRKNDLAEERKLLEFYLILLWGLIMNLLLNTLKKSDILFKKSMMRLKKLRRIENANRKLFTYEYG